MVAELRQEATCPTCGQERPIRFTDLAFDHSHQVATWRGQPIMLSMTEYHLLETLVSKGGAVATHDELFWSAWHPYRRLKIKTDTCHMLRVNIARLRKRLDAVTGGQLVIRAALERGYYLALDRAAR